MNGKIIYSKDGYIRSHWPLLCMLLLTVISFCPTFTNGFQTKWDDQWMVMNAYTADGLNWGRLWTSFSVGISGQYDPLNQLMYSMLYRIDGYNPLVYHATSLLLHLGNIICVLALMRTILNDCTSLVTERSNQIAIITTLLFAIHPLQVESVAWISASKIVLSTLFYLLGSMTFIRSLKRAGSSNYLLTLLLFLLSYLCKEAAVTFPLWATLLCLWYGLTPRMRRFWNLLTPLYVTALIMGLHLIFVVTSYSQYLQGDTYAWWQRVVFCFYALTTYAFKWLVPLNLNWMYQFPTNPDEALPSWLLPYPLLVGLLIYALWDWLRKGFIASALTFSLIHLLFVLHIIVLPRGAVIADRYMYLPLLGLNAILSYSLTSQKVMEKYKTVVIISLAVLALLFMGLSYQRTKDWADSSTLKKEKVIDNANKYKINKFQKQ